MNDSAWEGVVDREGLKRRRDEEKKNVVVAGKNSEKGKVGNVKS
jgi:hypothetical protein